MQAFTGSLRRCGAWASMPALARCRHRWGNAQTGADDSAVARTGGARAAFAPLSRPGRFRSRHGCNGNRPAIRQEDEHNEVFEGAKRHADFNSPRR